jgi:uncharacterized protein with PQ loop repeat
MQRYGDFLEKSKTKKINLHFFFFAVRNVLIFSGYGIYTETPTADPGAVDNTLISALNFLKFAFYLSLKK